jgi:hypothetical protein
MTPLSRRACGLALAGALAVTGTALAADSSYVVKHFKEPASRGLTVKKPLDEFVAVSDARVLVPKAWKAKGTTQFDTPSNGQCGYRVKFTVRSRIDDPGDAAARVKAAVPGSGPFVLDQGERNGSAWRVVRKSISGGIHVDAQWSGVLTRRGDIVPSGKVAWTDLSVSAESHKGDECHSGTYREVLGPQLGDALATARTSLKFVKP